MAEEWTDDDFLGYCQLHARTELALFHRGHVERLLRLAGKEVPTHLREWTSVHSEAADPLIAEARRILAEKRALEAVEHVHRL